MKTGRSGHGRGCHDRPLACFKGRTNDPRAATRATCDYVVLPLSVGLLVWPLSEEA